MGVELGNLATGSGSRLHEDNLELSAGSVHTGSGLLLGIGDVLDSLREALVLEGLLGAEGSVHTRGGSLKHHVGVVAVLGHASTNLAELGRSGRSDGTDLVVREVAEGLDLGSIGSDVAVGLLDLGVGGRSESGKSTLLVEH